MVAAEIPAKCRSQRRKRTGRGERDAPAGRQTERQTDSQTDRQTAPLAPGRHSERTPTSPPLPTEVHSYILHIHTCTLTLRMFASPPPINHATLFPRCDALPFGRPAEPISIAGTTAVDLLRVGEGGGGLVNYSLNRRRPPQRALHYMRAYSTYVRYHIFVPSLYFSPTLSNQRPLHLAKLCGRPAPESPSLPLLHSLALPPPPPIIRHPDDETRSLSLSLTHTHTHTHTHTKEQPQPSFSIPGCR